MDTTEFTPTPTPRDLLEFFGIPPSPPEELGANIREKRKYWKKKQQKARSDEFLALPGPCCRPSRRPRTCSHVAARLPAAETAGLSPGRPTGLR